MGVLDFLFEGKPPTSVTTYGTNTQNLPQWLSDYTQGLIAKANSVGADPYQLYEAPRIASFSPDQTAAQQKVRSNVGNYQPYFNQSGALSYAGANVDVTGAAQPFINQAGQSLPGNIQNYIDPYIGNVINRAELEANRNFQENIMPTLDNKFTSAGQYGSSAHQREADRAARDLTEGLQSQSQGALSQAYQQAGSQFQADQARQAQLAATSGDLASKAGTLKLQGAQQIGALGEAQQAAGLKDVSALSASGSEQQQQAQKNLDLAYQDFLQQRDYPRQTVDWLSSVIRGIPYGTSTATTQTGPASVYQPSPLSQIGSILAAGKGIADLFTEKNARGGVIKVTDRKKLRARRPGALEWVSTTR